jgi:hypothetical protein
MAYAILRKDLMSTNETDVVSVKYLGAGATPTAISNANIVKLSGLVSGEKEIFKGLTPATTTALDEIVLIGTPEVMYDANKTNLNEFVNASGSVCEGYRLKKGVIYSATVEAFDTAPAVGNYITIGNSTVPVVKASVTSEKVVGTCIAIETVGSDTYYVVAV